MDVVKSYGRYCVKVIPVIRTLNNPGVDPEDDMFDVETGTLLTAYVSRTHDEPKKLIVGEIRICTSGFTCPIHADVVVAEPCII